MPSAIDLLTPLAAADRGVARTLAFLGHGGTLRAARVSLTSAGAALRQFETTKPAGTLTRVDAAERDYLAAVRQALNRRAPANLRALESALESAFDAAKRPISGAPSLAVGTARLRCWASPGAPGCPRPKRAARTPAATPQPPAATATPVPTATAPPAAIHRPSSTSRTPTHTGRTHTGTTHTGTTHTGSTGD